MNVTIRPGALRGSVRAIPAKADVQRLLIAAALSEQESRLPWKDPVNAKASTASFEDLYGEALTRYADLVPRYLEAEGDAIVALFPVNYSGK